MNKKVLCLMGFLCSVILVDFGVCYSPNATIPFSINELSGQIDVTSPIENFTYTNSTIVVNASFHIGGIEYEPNTHYVPYQNIICIYSLDGSEWQNMSLVSVGGHEAFSSMVNSFWYSNTWLNYTAILHNVSKGTHLLQLDVKPDSLSPGIRSIHDLGKVSVNFNVSENSNLTKSNSALAFNNAQFFSVLFLVIGILSVTGAVLIYRRHRKIVNLKQ